MFDYIGSKIQTHYRYVAVALARQTTLLGVVRDAGH